MEREEAEGRESEDANALLAGGAVIATLGIVGAVVGSAVCPVCVVAAPALLGLGAIRKIRAARRKRARPTSVERGHGAGRAGDADA